MQHVARVRAERDANANLPRAFGDGVRDDAVDAKRREAEREEREDHERGRDEIVALAVAQQPELLVHRLRGQQLIGRARHELPAQRDRQTCRVPRSANRDVDGVATRRSDHAVAFRRAVVERAEAIREHRRRAVELHDKLHDERCSAFATPMTVAHGALDVSSPSLIARPTALPPGQRKRAVAWSTMTSGFPATPR